MKTLKFLNLALALSLVSFAVVSCGDDNNNEPIEPTAGEVVAGEYTGNMTLTPAEGEAMSPETAAFEIKNGKIAFTSFPLKSIVTSVLESIGTTPTEEDIDDLITLVGPIPYEIPFTAAYNEAKTEVALTLTPGAFEIDMTDPLEPEPTAMKINVTITAPSAGKYVAGTKKLAYSLSVDKVMMNEVDLGLPVMTLAFDSTKK